MPDERTQLQLPKQSYVLSSRPELAEDLWNLYAEEVPKGGRSAYMLRGSPGTVLFAEFGTGPVSAIADLHGFLYMVSGSQAYRLVAGGTPLLLGDVLPDTAATIAIGPTQAVICTPPKAYFTAHDGALSLITGDDLPDFSSVAYLDGYFVFTIAGTGQFALSKLLDGSIIDPLDYASQEAMPDVVKRGVSHLGTYWLFGADAIEVWRDVGAADFAFRRQDGAVIYGGTTAPESIAKLDNSLCWLGRDNIVYQSDGFQARRISSHAMEQALTVYGVTDDAHGCTYTLQGSKFYALTFPSAPNSGATWVYNAATKLWHRQGSFGLQGRWRARTAAQFGQSPIIGDYQSGKLFFLAPDIATDNGTILYRQAVFPPIQADQKRAFMSRFEVEMEVGTALVPASMYVDWSDDGGTIYSPVRALNVGAVAQRETRPFTTRLGSFRNRVMRLTISGPSTIYGAVADVSQAAY